MGKLYPFLHQFKPSCQKHGASLVSLIRPLHLCQYCVAAVAAGFFYKVPFIFLGKGQAPQVLVKKMKNLLLSSHYFCNYICTQTVLSFAFTYDAVVQHLTNIADI